MNDLYDDLFFQREIHLYSMNWNKQNCGVPLTETECWESLKLMQIKPRKWSITSRVLWTVLERNSSLPWRPITLLNCDYKIATKCIGAEVLPRLIDNDQTCFLKNRFIEESIRLVDSVINYANIEQIPGLLLFIDLEKAFDSLEWSFIEKTLNYYNFEKSLVASIRLVYTDIISCVQNNGWTSEFFSLSCGVRQGC